MFQKMYKKISQQVAKLCRKLKWLLFFWDTMHIFLHVSLFIVLLCCVFYGVFFMFLLVSLFVYYTQ